MTVTLARVSADVCAYCGKAVLTGRERPEHPIPAALGSSLEVFTVCDPCNAWASAAIDQPFLRDDWTRLHRAAHDVRDPRRGSRRPVPHPFKHGFTDDGVPVTLDEDWRPKLGSRIVEEGDRVQIQAGSMEEAERLRKRVEKAARREGKEARIERVKRIQDPSTVVNIEVEVDAAIWLRMAAKIALGVGSHVYPPDWRTSADAAELRSLMRDVDRRTPSGARPALFPEKLKAEDAFRRLMEPPEHLVCFLRSGRGTAGVLVVLFGELAFGLPVDTTDRPLPSIAWRLDPRRPRRRGETTWDALMLSALRRSGALESG